MRIFNWMQKKLINGKQDSKRSFDPVSISAPSYDRKEEFSDWPQALLAIGTFGNKDISDQNQETVAHDHDDHEYSSEDDQELHDQEESISQDHLQDFTLEEVTKLQNELTKLLKHKPKPKTDAPEIEEDRAVLNLPLNRFLNCPSSLEVDRIANINTEAKNIVLNKAKDVLMDNGTKIRRRSISFLLKKMFACKTTFPPMPNIRDSVPESRFDKLLRMILRKKIYPQSSTPALLKKYLDKKQDEKRIKDEEDEGCKWVKTDSEFIVLEM